MALLSHLHTFFRMRNYMLILNKAFAFTFYSDSFRWRKTAWKRNRLRSGYLYNTAVSDHHWSRHRCARSDYRYCDGHYSYGIDRCIRWSIVGCVFGQILSSRVYFCKQACLCELIAQRHILCYQPRMACLLQLRLSKRGAWVMVRNAVKAEHLLYFKLWGSREDRRKALCAVPHCLKTKCRILLSDDAARIIVVFAIFCETSN